MFVDLSSLFSLLFFATIVSTRLFINEEDFGDLTREKIVAEADLISETLEPTQCKYVRRVKRQYELTVITSGGQEVRVPQYLLDTTLPTRVSRHNSAECVESEKYRMLICSYLRYGGSISLTTFPGLNCLDQEDPELIRSLQQDYLLPPSRQDISTQNVPLEARYSQYQQDLFLDKIIFEGKMQNGFFVEAGGGDFLTASNSLYFEEKHNWTGLLLEPDPIRYQQGMAWSAPICLSPHTRPDYFQFAESVETGYIAIIAPGEEEGEDTEYQCFPIYALLLALDNSTLNLLSLDIEGAEFEVIKTIPWDKVDIEVILLDNIDAEKVSPGSRLETIQFLDSRNFQYIGNLYDDIFVRRDLLNSKYKINIEEADEHFKRFSSDLMFQSEKFENKGFSYISKYLLNLNKYDPNLTTRNCLTWMAQTTPSHKYVLPRDAKNTLRQDFLILNKGEKEYRRNRFNRIFDQNEWGESKSGHGSLQSSTKRIKAVLGSVIDEIKKHLKKDQISILDSSCGDMLWMSEFLDGRPDVVFTGFDIVQSNIDNHRRSFSDKAWRFRTQDIVTDPIESSYDLILSRHTTQHLRTEEALRVFRNFINSNSKFLLTTNYPNTKINNDLWTDTETKWMLTHRPLNVFLSPFHFPPAICSFQDAIEDSIMLWDLSTISLASDEDMCASH